MRRAEWPHRGFGMPRWSARFGCRGVVGVAEAFEVAVVGGGVIGCAVAAELALRGVSVALLERGRIGAGASYGAGGMLAPQVEADAPGPFLELGVASRDMFPALSARLNHCFDLGLTGVVRVAHGEDAAGELRARVEWQRRLGLNARVLDAAELRELAPGLAREPRAAIWMPDGQASPAPLTAALAHEAARHGARVREGVPVLGVASGHVWTSEGSVVAGTVVVAAGAWSAGLLAVHPAGPGRGAASPGGVPAIVRPVKGQRVLLRLPGQPLGLTTWGEGCYLIPRAGGHLLVGATEEPAAGFDCRATAGAVARLLQAAIALVPALEAAEVVEPWAGLRPATPDLLPLIGPVPGLDGVWLATGHHRNGILLAPLTARAIADALLEGAPLPAACLPERLAGGWGGGETGADGGPAGGAGGTA